MISKPFQEYRVDINWVKRGEGGVGQQHQGEVQLYQLTLISIEGGEGDNWCDNNN